jgi:hypothetical protein
MPLRISFNERTSPDCTPCRARKGCAAAGAELAAAASKSMARKGAKYRMKDF